MKTSPARTAAFRKSERAIPKVSVVIPSYNHERFVGRAIESTLGQTFQDFEIVITDDASTDDSVSILRAHADADKRISLFLNRFNYETHATNHSIEHASGEYIAVLSSDDEFHPTKLEQQVTFLDQHPEVAAVFTFARIVDDEGRAFPNPSHPLCSIFQQPNRSRHEWLRYFFLVGNCLCHPSVLIRRSVYDTLGLYNPLMGALDDLDMWVRICLHHEIHIIPSALVNFTLRHNHENVSADKPENVRRGHFELIKIFDHFRSPEGLDQIHLIFPELATECAHENDAVKCYVLAMAALKQGGSSHRFWAIDLLYQLLSDPDAKSRLRHKIGAAPDVDFIKLCGTLWPLTYEHRATAQLFWTDDGVFSEVKSASRFIDRSLWNELVLPLPALSANTFLRFDPCDCPGVVRLAGFRIISKIDHRCIWELSPKDLRQAVKLEGTAIWSSDEGNDLAILSTGIDPQVLLAGLPPIPDLPVELRVWLKLEGLARVAQQIEAHSELQHRAAELEAELARVAQQIEAHQDRAAKLEAELLQLTAEHAVERERLTVAIAERDDVVDLIRSSTSWRLTRPLRSLGAFLRSERVEKLPERK